MLASIKPSHGDFRDSCAPLSCDADISDGHQNSAPCQSLQRTLCWGTMSDAVAHTLTANGAGHAGVRKALDGDGGPHLVIVPASLLENWQRELAKWCPGLRVVTYYGKERWQLREELKDWR